MLRSPFSRKAAVLLLLAVLAVPWASAASPRQADARPAKAAAESHDLVSRFWSFLTSIWSESGCRIDPDGRCVPNPQPQTDEGCMIDPNGRCAS